MDGKQQGWARRCAGHLGAAGRRRSRVGVGILVAAVKQHGLLRLGNIGGNNPAEVQRVSLGASALSQGCAIPGGMLGSGIPETEERLPGELNLGKTLCVNYIGGGSGDNAHERQPG